MPTVFGYSICRLWRDSSSAFFSRFMRFLAFLAVRNLYRKERKVSKTINDSLYAIF
jgi:hypothetical protein